MYILEEPNVSTLPTLFQKASSLWLTDLLELSTFSQGTFFGTWAFWHRKAACKYGSYHLGSRVYTKSLSVYLSVWPYQ